MSLSVRACGEEQMDDPALDADVYDRVLHDLARVNRWTLAARPTLAFLDRTVGQLSSFTLLDVGFGEGDMLRRIARWAQKRGIVADLLGIDLNPKSEVAARALTPADATLEYRTGDYRNLAGPFDCVISSLVAHHMTATELRDFIRYMETHCRRGWLINDLHRHRLAYAGYPILARLLGVHRIVREDGTRSIARSFRASEWRSILADAGVPERAARIIRRFPFRLCVERRF